MAKTIMMIVTKRGVRSMNGLTLNYTILRAFICRETTINKNPKWKGHKIHLYVP